MPKSSVSTTPVPTSTPCVGYPIDDLFLQLHEQYAINNNSNMSTVVTLVITLMAVFASFGYVYVNTINDFSCNFCLLFENGHFYFDVLLLIYIVSTLVLSAMICICTYQGVSQRKEQFIIYAIRLHYSIQNTTVRKKNKNNTPIFPSKYNPFGKKGLEIVQGLYGEMIKIFIIVFLFLTIGVVMKFCFMCPIPCNNCIVLCLTIFFISITAFITYFYCKKQFQSYYDRENEYKDIK